MNVIKWQDPPDPPFPPTRTEWSAVAEELAARPGVWALVGERISSSAYMHLKALGCEARSQHCGDGWYNIYARWPKVSS